MNAKNYFKLIARVLSKNVPEYGLSEQNIHESNEFQEASKVWELTDLVQVPVPPKGQWAKLVHAIQKEESIKSAAIMELTGEQKIIISSSAYNVMRIAAVLLIACISMWIIQKTFFPQVVVATQKGERSAVNLPDGSRVELNAVSRLSYSKDFAKDTREVSLEGEAFFDVHPGTDLFVVKTKYSIIEVLGTEFNIRERKNTTTVVVVEGRVAVENLDTSEQVILQKGEMTRVSQGVRPSSPQKVEVERFLAWRDGRMEFERTSVIEMFETLERRYNVRIRFKNVPVENQTITASFGNTQTIEEILSAICLTLNWNYKSFDGGYEVFIKEM